MNISKRQAAYVDAILEFADTLGIDCSKDTFTRAELRQVSMHFKGKKWIPNWITHDQSRRSGRGMFNIPEVSKIWRSMNEDSKVESIVNDVLEPVMA
jgi:hypothetical protein